MTLMITILNNKYFFILLFLISLYIVITIYDSFPYVKKDQNHQEFLRAIDNYYVKNLYYELFILLLYISSYFGIFLFFRLQLLGKDLNIMALGNLGHFNFNILTNLLLYIVSVIFYIKIINSLFYPNLIKLHYYFYQFEWYESIIDQCHMEFSIITDFIENLSSMAKYLWSKKAFDNYSVRMMKLQRIAFQGTEKLQQIEENQKKQDKLWYRIHNNFFLIVLIIFCVCFLKLFDQFSRQLRSISYPILLIIILWEIHTGKLYYIYYALFIYFMTIWIRKIRYFLSVRDPIEKAITVYFYSNEIPYRKIKVLLENNDISEISNNVGEDTRHYYDLQRS